MEGTRQYGRGLSGVIVTLSIAEMIVIKDLCDAVASDVMDIGSPVHKLIQIVGKMVNTGLELDGILGELTDDTDIYLFKSKRDDD